MNKSPDAKLDLLAKIEAMTPSNRLRLAADLLEHGPGQLSIAYTLVQNEGDRLYAMLQEKQRQ